MIDPTLQMALDEIERTHDYYEMLCEMSDQELESHLTRLRASSVRNESTFAEPMPAVVYDDETEPPF